ncbi:MAG: HPP family protein [Deltaproteobacteria bacterium]|nr:HPP family protein [Deltaproteobacteria bacterium]
MLNYFQKMKGGGKSQPPPPLTEVFWSFFGAFVGMALLYIILNHFRLAPLDNLFDLISESDMSFIIGSFGASAVLIFGIIDSPLAQPRNLVGGHVLSAVVGVLCYQLFYSHLWLAVAIAVSASIVVMQLTKTLHPPGSATALIAVIGSPQLHDLGYLYVLIPILRGALILLIVALLVNNIPKSRRYPKFWW